MEIKLFGKNIFEYKNSRNIYFDDIAEQIKKEDVLPDFYTAGRSNDLSDYIIIPDTDGGAVAVPQSKVAPQAHTIHLTPKGIYATKTLHDEGFKFGTDPEYVDGLLQDFKDKFDILNRDKNDMARGAREISSMIQRLENRKKYPEFESFYSEYPYTLTSKIVALTKAHDYLQLGNVSQFVADMPKEAVAVMKEYDKTTKSLCGKKCVYYILADKKDFKKTESRKDPILFAQSPFGHFWQILGAWDEEMLLLENL